jgi:DNA-binding MarR family transcriptional regulator/GNAT superfamily N-acetyltransferase
MAAALHPAPPPVAAIRSFNRFYTRKIGSLNEGLLDSPFSLTEVRVLYEIAHHPGLTATKLGHDLGLDAGYLSRILRRFTRKRLLQRTSSEQDARQSHLELTALGAKTFAALDRRSSTEAARLVAHLPATEQARLTSLFRAARHLLSADDERPHAITLREPKAGDYGWVVQRHGALYAQEYGWNEEFEGLVARIIADFIEHRDPTRERAWIADREGEPVGCVFLVRHTATIAKLRLLLVEPSARGHKLGSRLVDECVRFAREASYRKIILWTNDVLHAARRIYEHAGFRLIESKPHHSFGHDLIGETWELPLAKLGNPTS